jgi:regulator of sigma E protease
MGVVPKRPVIPPVLGEISAGGPAAVAGLRQGDRVLLVDGEEVGDWSRFVAYIQQRPGERIEMQIQRDRMSETIGVDVGQKVVDGRLVGRIGAGVAVPEDLYDQYRVEIRYGPLEAIGVASIRTWDTSVFMLRILGRMLVGEVSVKNLSGPISIAQTAGKSASYGFTQFLKFLALVSVSLGVLNLLPVPVLDGGHLLFFLIEAIKGSPLSEEAQAQGQRVGLLLLLALMGLAFYVDLSRLLG